MLIHNAYLQKTNNIFPLCCKKHLLIVNKKICIYDDFVVLFSK
jgi:hypothetical protein